MNLEQSFNEYEEKYLSMIGHKSASLIAASAECAALLKSEVELLNSKNMESSGENARGLEFATNCHIERSEISSIESNKDISPFSKARTSKALAHTCKYDNMQNLDSKNYTLNPLSYPNLTGF